MARITQRMVGIQLKMHGKEVLDKPENYVAKKIIWIINPRPIKVQKKKESKDFQTIGSSKLDDINKILLILKIF